MGFLCFGESLGMNRMKEDEKAIMMLVVIVGLVLIWVVLEELNYLGFK